MHLVNHELAKRKYAALMPVDGHMSFFWSILSNKAFLFAPRRTLQLFRSVAQSSSAASANPGANAHQPNATFPGFICQTLGTKNYLLSADPEIVKQVLMTKFKQFGKEENYRQHVPFFGPYGEPYVNLFTTDSNDPKWRNLRRLFNPVFSDTNMEEVAANFVEKQTEEVIQLWKEGGDKTVVEPDALQTMSALTLDVVTSSMFGEHVGAIRDGSSKITGTRGKDLARYA